MEGSDVNRPQHPGGGAPLPDPTTKMTEGWHCLHLYYNVCESTLKGLSRKERARGRAEICNLLNPDRDGAPERIQTFVVSGHKADLGICVMDPDPLKIDAIVQGIRSSGLGSALKTTYSFVSITEISEYVPTVEQYSERLKREGSEPGSRAPD